jgi:hypothetical protein
MYKPWLISATLLALAAGMVALWHSNQKLLEVVRAERHARLAAAPPAPANNAVARPRPAPAPAAPAESAVQPVTVPTNARATKAVAPAADPIVISDNRSWKFSAGYLESAEDGLLRFAGGIGIAYLDGVWLTGERADIAFSSGPQEASTITIPDQATVHIGNDTMNIAGNCVIQSTNGQITSITAEQISVSRPLTNAAPPVSAPREPITEPVAEF